MKAACPLCLLCCTRLCLARGFRSNVQRLRQLFLCASFLVEHVTYVEHAKAAHSLTFYRHASSRLPRASKKRKTVKARIPVPECASTRTGALPRPERNAPPSSPIPVGKCSIVCYDPIAARQGNEQRAVYAHARTDYSVLYMNWTTSS